MMKHLIVSLILCSSFMAINYFYVDVSGKNYFLNFFKEKSNKKFNNIVLIIADDLGWSDIGYANEQAITPNIDRLANEGIILDQFYTYALCTPSRASVMSGIFVEKTGLEHSVIENPIPIGLSESIILMPQHLKNFGYQTHLVGKWNLGFCNKKYLPTNRGFDTFYGFYDAQEDYYTHRIDYEIDNKTYDGLDFWNQTSEYLEPILDKNGTFSQFLFNQRAVEILDTHDNTKPFFLYFAAQVPHRDLVDNCPEEYSNRFLHIDDIYRRKTLGLVSILDESIGNITDALKRNNLLDDTLIFFMSDNGGELVAAGRNYPLRGGKRTVFEGGHRVRAFINGKGLKHYTYEGMFHAVDWLPTIVSAGLNKPVEFLGIDGINQWNAITQNLQSKRNSFVYNIDPVGNLGCTYYTEAIRDGDWKLIKGCPGIYTDWYNLTEFDIDAYTEYSGINISISYTNPSCIDEQKTPNYTYFLFNIKDDPFEKTNLAADFPCKVKDLEIKINEYKTELVPPLINTYPPKYDSRSDPGKFGDKWTPGWCE